MTKPNAKKAKLHLAKLRQLISKRKSHLSNMSKEDVIQALRKSREEIWEQKYARRMQNSKRTVKNANHQN